MRRKAKEMKDTNVVEKDELSYRSTVLSLQRSLSLFQPSSTQLFLSCTRKHHPPTVSLKRELSGTAEQTMQWNEEGAQTSARVTVGKMPTARVDDEGKSNGRTVLSTLTHALA